MLAFRIRQARIENGLKQGDLANILVVSRTTIVNWETGYANPNGERLHKLAEALGITVEWLLDTSNDENEFVEVKEHSEEPNTFLSSFAQRLRTLRKNKGLTQLQLAQTIGLERSTYNGYENGNREPDLETVKLMCEKLEVSADHILGVKELNYHNPFILVSEKWISEINDASDAKKEAIKKIWEVVRDI